METSSYRQELNIHRSGKSVFHTNIECFYIWIKISLETNNAGFQNEIYIHARLYTYISLNVPGIKLASFFACLYLRIHDAKRTGFSRNPAGARLENKRKNRQENGGNGSTSVFCMTSSSQPCVSVWLETNGKMFRRRYATDKFTQPWQQYKIVQFLTFSALIDLWAMYYSLFPASIRYFQHFSSISTY